MPGFGGASSYYDAHHREGTGSSSEESSWTGEPQDEEEEQPQSESMKALVQIDKECVSNVLKKLDSIRQLAGDAQVLRRKETREQNTRRLHLAQIHSLLLEEAEFNPQAVRQRNVLAMLEGIKLSNAEIFFFSTDESRKKLATGPSVKLRDAIARPYRYAERLLVDSDVLSRMFTELSTHQILDIVTKCTEYLTYMQTTYQLKPVEEKDSFHVRNASGIAIFRSSLLVVDSVNHCVWCVATGKITAQGSHEVKLYAGAAKEPGFQDGPRFDARFRCPTGIVVSDRTHEAFVTDSENHMVRVIDMKSETVTTIHLIISPSSMEVYGCSFTQPKGICVINGDVHLFKEMEEGQRRQVDEFIQYKASSEDLQQIIEDVPDQNSSASMSSFSSHHTESESVDDSEEDSEEQSFSGSGSSPMSSSDHSSSLSSSETASSGEHDQQPPDNKRNFKARNQQRGHERSSKSRHQEQGGSATSQIGGYGEQLSLEQSLSFERMKKYVVLHEPWRRPPRPSIRTMTGSSTQPSDGAAASLGASRVGSVAGTHMSPSGAAASRRQSACDAIRDAEEQQISREIRLAVTCDHCVWYIDPMSGKANIIAGHPSQYGYFDAHLGMAARFSSPKGVICIRSILFITDYWNNVIRTINLWTGRVDTVVDFNPQGPMAIAVSNSGVLYVLDSDEIHYTNILRIMSTQRDGDGGSISTPNLTDDRLAYQNLFSQPRSRQHSSCSESTFVTKKSEVWDAYKQKKLLPSSVIPSELLLDGQDNESDQPNDDFRSRLEEHLKTAAQESEPDEHEKKKGKRKKGVKKKRKKHKRHSRKNDRKKSKERRSGPMRPEDDPMYIDPRLLQGCAPVHPLPNIQIQQTNGQTSQVSSQHGSYLLEPLQDGEDDKSGDEASDDGSSVHEPLAHALKQQLEKLEIDDGTCDDTPQADNGRPKGFTMEPGEKSKDANLRSVAKKKKASGSLSPQDVTRTPTEKLAKSPDPPQDHVELMKLRLNNAVAMEKESQSRLQSRRGSFQAAPMTLSDLGVSGPLTADHAAMGGFSNAGMMMQRGSWKNPGQTLMGGPLSETNIESAGAALLYQNQAFQNGLYRMMACDDQDVGDKQVDKDAGTVMVSGGKAFYRSTETQWSEFKRTNPNQNSEETDTWNGKPERLQSPQTYSRGEDENGRPVNFVDNTQSEVDEEDETPETSRQLHAAAAKLLHSKSMPLAPSAFRGSLRGGSLAPSRLGSTNNSRRPSVSFGANEMQFIPSQQNSLKRDGEESSIAQSSVPNMMRRASLPGLTDDKRASVGSAGPISRRGSESRRGSLAGLGDAVDVALRGTETGMGSVVNSRRGSLGGNPVNTVNSRRGSLVNIAEPQITVGPNMNRRRSILERRGSISLNIMPTVLDHDDEKLDEEVESSQSGSGSEDSTKTKRGGSKSASKKSASEAGAKVNDNEGSQSTARSDSVVSSSQSSEEKEQKGTDKDETTSAGSADSSGKKISQSKSSTTLNDVSQELSATGGLSNQNSTIDLEPTSPKEIVSLATVPFTRDIDVNALQELSVASSNASMSYNAQEQGLRDAAELLQSRRRTTLTTTFGTYKITAAQISKTWRRLPLPEPLSSAHRNRGGKRYPNTPLSIAWHESHGENFVFVGLQTYPNLLKIIPPKHHEPDKAGRFNVLPIDSQRVLLADDSSHQIWLFNHQHSIIKHLAGCGKRGYLDGPLETCRMHAPCALTIDPRSHYIYVADRGNHVIRKIDLMSGLMSTAVGNGTRGNSDGVNPMRQALDSPFEVSFAEPHFLLISCSDNSIRSFNLKTHILETILVGS